MTTPGLREIAKEPFSSIRHPIPGHGTGLSDVFGKKILTLSQLSEEENVNINSIVSLLPGTLEMNKESLKLVASHSQKKAKLAEVLSENDTDKLFAVARMRRQAHNQVAYFVSTALSLREHFDATFEKNKTDLIAFVGKIEKTLESTNFELLNRIIMSWGSTGEISSSELEMLKDFVFEGNIPMDVTVAGKELQERIEGLKKSGPQMVPFLPDRTTRISEDTDLFRWLLGEKGELPAYFLRITGLAIRNASQAPAFLLIPQFLREILVGYVGVLNTRNMLATIMMMEKTLQATHAVIAQSTEHYTAAVALASAIGIDMTNEFKYYEQNWKPKAAKEGVFGTTTYIQSEPTVLDEWVLNWAGLTKKQGKELTEDIPAQEIRFRMQSLFKKKLEKQNPFDELQLDSNFDTW